MTLSDRSPARKAAFEKLADVPEEMLSSVVSFLDSLVDREKRASEERASESEQSGAALSQNAAINPRNGTTEEPIVKNETLQSDEIVNPDWNKWQKIFDELDELPPTEPHLLNLTKKEKGDLWAEDIAKKYNLPIPRQE